MKLEDQVCSLDLAKRLKELGVKQESVFAWVDGFPTQLKTVVRDGDGTMPWADVRVSASFTVAELGEMLPQGSATFSRSFGMGWKCLPPRKMQDLPHQIANTEADARAKMLIYLIENNLITL